MYASSFVRRHITRLPQDAIFTTRDFLSYGSRTAIDNALYRLVKAEVIVRLAWGVFAKYGSRIPDVAEVAKVKAQSFGKEILAHSTTCLAEFSKSPDINATTEVSESDSHIVRFAVKGKTSTFRYQHFTVTFVGVSPRKFQLSTSAPGRIILALWELGKERCTPKKLSKADYLLWRTGREEVKASARLIPSWLVQHWVNEARHIRLVMAVP